MGGGVAGLSVAFELMERSQRLPNEVEFLCLEASDRPGGKIRTLRRDGYICEWGPNGFQDDSAATLTLVRRLGLQDRVLQAKEEAENRFIFRKGQLRRVPTDTRALLSSDFLPLSGKLRLMAEPLAIPHRGEEDESVFDFVRRRLGFQAADLLADAIVSGTYAGDASSLSILATFPKLRRMEAEHGSLFKAMLARRREARESGSPSGGPAGPGGKLMSFRGGMQELTDALASRLGRSLWLDTPVTTVSDIGRRGFRIHRGKGAPLDVASLVLACPAWISAGLVADTDRKLSEALAGIAWTPLVVVHFGYRESNLGKHFQAFGFLVPRGHGVRMLGTIWASDVFDGRAPEGGVLTTSMVGGAHDPQAVKLTDSELAEIIKSDLRTTVAVLAQPHFVEIMRHRRGIPQYTLGHLDRVAAIENRLRRHPGLFVCGNSYRGVSVNACVEEAPRVAEAVLAHLF